MTHPPNGQGSTPPARLQEFRNCACPDFAAHEKSAAGSRSLRSFPGKLRQSRDGNLCSGGRAAAEVFDNALRLDARDHARQLLEARLAQVRDAAKLPQQLLRRALADPGDVRQLAVQVAARAALAVETDGKAVGLIADLLDEMENGRMPLQQDRLVLLPEDVDHFFFFRDAGERLVDDLEFLQRCGSRVELPDAAVDQDQAG